jgi:hypothetical protein
VRRRLVALFIACLPALASAGNVAPLGLEVGVADLQAVRAKLGRQTRLLGAGTNKWTGGPMLKSNGSGLDIEGLQEFLFVFGRDKKLEGVILTMRKERLRAVAELLRTKYTPAHEDLPFVGDASATYHMGESLARIEAPHLSSSMNVLYLTHRLQAAYDSGSALEEAEHRRRQAEKF